MRAAYDAIYFDIKGLIEDGTYPYKTFLPSESMLVKQYDCAHNTVRKALAILAADGYVQPVHGKGVRVIYQELRPSCKTIATYHSSGIESFTDVGERSGFEPGTKVLGMEHMVVDRALASRTHFEMGESVVRLERVRLYDGVPLARVTNFFRADIVEGLTEEDARQSVYRYIESTGNNKLVTSKKRITVERANAEDRNCLALEGTDYVAVVRLLTFDADGFVCEFAEMHHHPSVFALEQTVIRTRTN